MNLQHKGEWQVGALFLGHDALQVGSQLGLHGNVSEVVKCNMLSNH